MKTISNDKLEEILKQHESWLKDEGGEQADLSDTDLSGANLCGADLREADLRRADLYYADLSGANLCGADLREADLCGADLTDIVADENTAGYWLVCPEKGSFIGFKKASGHIIKLLIPAKAKRSSATTRKCRCEFAKVLSITCLDGSRSCYNKVVSDRGGVVYRIGEMVYPDSFDEDRWSECSHGIHFFITRQEAVNYYGGVSMDESTYYKVRDFVQSNVCACITDFAPYLFGEENDRYASYDEWDNMWFIACPHCGDEIDEDECELSEDDPEYVWPSQQYRCPHCDELFREPDQLAAEIYEYWIVTPWLGEKLRNHGEAVLERRGGWVWGRQGTGQAIALDSVMRDIAKEYGIIGEDEEV